MGGYLYQYAKHSLSLIYMLIIPKSVIGKRIGKNIPYMKLTLIIMMIDAYL